MHAKVVDNNYLFLQHFNLATSLLIWGPRSNLRGPKFPWGSCPQTPLRAAFSTHDAALLMIGFPPKQKNHV